tara:strand:+ start:129 stop:401 length:273 start_codon:yes stop_codon:yes gene_type:complete
MKKLLKIVTVSLVLSVASITQASSNMDKETIKEKILIETSTQEKILEKFGEPTNKSLRGNKETWYYDTKKFTLAVEFDAYGTVIDYSIVK